MPFLEMVIFMVKWVIASIPAFLILTILFGGLIFLGFSIKNSTSFSSQELFGFATLVFFGVTLAGVIFYSYKR